MKFKWLKPSKKKLFNALFLTGIYFLGFSVFYLFESLEMRWVIDWEIMRTHLMIGFVIGWMFE